MLRDATETDLESIRRWRNHPKVRGSFIWTDYITPEEHAAWWKRVEADPTRRVLIFEFHDVPCGVVLIIDIDESTRTTEWGFFLDVDALESRGELLPGWIALETEAVRYAFDELGLLTMGGRTLAWNQPVLALHHRFGFVDVPERSYRTVVAGVEQDVIWTELRRDRRP